MRAACVRYISSFLLLSSLFVVAFSLSAEPCFAQGAALGRFRPSNSSSYHKSSSPKTRKSFFTSRATRKQRQQRGIYSSLSRAKVGGTALNKGLSKTVAEDPSATAPGSKTLVSNEKSGEAGNPGADVPRGSVDGGAKPPPSSQPGVPPPQKPQMPDICPMILQLVQQLAEKLKEKGGEQQAQQEAAETEQASGDS